MYGADVLTDAQKGWLRHVVEGTAHDELDAAVKATLADRRGWLKKQRGRFKQGTPNWNAASDAYQSATDALRTAMRSADAGDYEPIAKALAMTRHLLHRDPDEFAKALGGERGRGLRPKPQQVPKARAPKLRPHPDEYRRRYGRCPEGYQFDTELRHCVRS